MSKNSNDTLTQRGKWNVLTRIEKFDNNSSLKEGVPDEVCEIPGNLLLNNGINAIWALFAGDTEIEVEVDDGSGNLVTTTLSIDPFNHDNSYIGVGNFHDLDGDWVNTVEEEDDETLTGPLKMFMKMDTNEDKADEYPIRGKNQKIIFKSTFGPGVACFKWYEWCIANGNCNFSAADIREDFLATRGQVSGFYTWDGTGTDDGFGYEIVTAALGNNPQPDPVPTIDNNAFEYGDGDKGVSKGGTHILLNHKRENMGEKYPPSTWIITVEISLV